MLSLRQARPDDEDRLRRWRNEAATQAASFTSAEVSVDEHQRWFARKLQDPDCVLLIVEVDGHPAGQVRLDRLNPDVAEISVGLAPEARGRGLGREAIRRAVREAPRLLHVKEIAARVKPDNRASLSAFVAAGFEVVRSDESSVELRRGTEVDPPTGER
jgi:RimJ/RimL family protein N-acetyltransferase